MCLQYRVGRGQKRGLEDKQKLKGLLLGRMRTGSGHGITSEIWNGEWMCEWAAASH